MEVATQISDLDRPRTCFVVSAFGKTAEEQRTFKQVLRHLIERVLKPDYEVVRADQIDDEGLITNQIIEHLIEDHLVVADLTGLNPNVFYEVAVRHAARKPIVHLVTRGQNIPFDVANMRAVQYALDDPDFLEEAQKDLLKKVQAIEDSDFKAASNPVSAAVDVALLRSSEVPEARETGEVLASLQELRDDVRNLARRIPSEPSPPTPPARWARSGVANTVLAALRLNGPRKASDLAQELELMPKHVAQSLRELSNENIVGRNSDRQWEAI